jgi:hypothetical protein
MTGTSH